MIKSNGNNELVISNPKMLLTLISIFIVIFSGISYVVDHNTAIDDHERRLLQLESEYYLRDTHYMPRNELNTNFKLVAEQLNRIEQKTDMFYSTCQKLIKSEV